MTVPSPHSVSVTPEPTEAELAAILAAYTALWPSPAVADSAIPVSRRWKFQGRWWVEAQGQRGSRASWQS